VKRTTCDCGRYEVFEDCGVAEEAFEDGEHGGAGDLSPVTASATGASLFRRRQKDGHGVVPGCDPNPVTGVITGDAGEESSSGCATRVLTNRESIYN
jgi:hypothetical protein